MIYGKTPTLISVTYIKPNKRAGIDECFEVVYLDDSNELRVSYEQAEADIYIVKPEFRDYDYFKPQEYIERMDKVTCLVSEIRFKIAEAIGDEGVDFIKECYANSDYKSLNRLYGWKYAFGCDFQPEFYFMRSWYAKYESKLPKLTKSYMDIELSTMDYMPDLDNLGATAYSEINLITQYFDETNEMVTFVLRPWKPSKIGISPEEYPERYRLYEKQLADHNKLFADTGPFIKDLHDSFDGVYGNINYKIREYEQEIDLIADVFKMMHSRKPTFCLTWNMRFDIQYITERIKVLGYDPVSVMCDKNFKSKRCYFQVDRVMFQIEKQFDYFNCSMMTEFLCQMRLYASIRKSQQMLKSVKLTDIGERELRDKKIEYPDETNMKYFPYVDWIRFIKYNIKDVLIQVGVERKTNDVMTYYSRSHMNLTPYNKIFRETHLLRNVREKFFEEDGLVQSNNINIIGKDEDLEWARSSNDDDEDSDKVLSDGKSTFKGAIMANPIYNAKIGVDILGRRTNAIFRNAMDYDMGAFYPSIKIASNMDPGSLLYKAAFNNEEFISGEFINNSLNTTYYERDKHNQLRKQDITGEAVNTFCSGNVLTFAHNYLGMPSADVMLQKVQSALKR